MIVVSRSSWNKNRKLEQSNVINVVSIVTWNKTETIHCHKKGKKRILNLTKKKYGEKCHVQGR